MNVGIKSGRMDALFAGASSWFCMFRDVFWISFMFCGFSDGFNVPGQKKKFLFSFCRLWL